MSSRTMHDINVIGTLQLLTACESSPSIRTIVIRGSAGIYGAEPHAPQFFSEEMARLFPLRTRFQRDVGEIENYFETYSRRHPGVVCTMLRYQPAIGPGARHPGHPLSLLAAWSRPTSASTRGIQFVHEQDGLDALTAAVQRPVRGAVNVASPGTIGLARMIRLARRPSLPVAGPLFGVGHRTDAAGRAGRAVRGLPPPAALRPRRGHHAAGRTRWASRRGSRTAEPPWRTT